MDKKQLVQLAKSFGIKGRHAMNKADLVTAMLSLKELEWQRVISEICCNVQRIFQNNQDNQDNQDNQNDWAFNGSFDVGYGLVITKRIWTKRSVRYQLVFEPFDQLVCSVGDAFGIEGICNALEDMDDWVQSHIMITYSRLQPLLGGAH